MARLNNTPQPFSLHPPQKPVLRGQLLLDRLEDDYSDYRADVANRLCKDDPTVHAHFKAAIASARQGLLQPTPQS